MAPADALIPQLIPPPSNAGPAEQAQHIIKSLLPNTISPLVPKSINNVFSSLAHIPAANTPAVISPPT